MPEFRVIPTSAGDVPLLPPSAAPAAKPPDVLERFTVTFRALPGDPRPPAVRVRLALKYALRAQRLANDGISDPPA